MHTVKSLNSRDFFYIIEIMKWKHIPDFWWQGKQMDPSFWAPDSKFKLAPLIHKLSHKS